MRGQSELTCVAQCLEGHPARERSVADDRDDLAGGPVLARASRSPRAAEMDVEACPVWEMS